MQDQPQANPMPPPPTFSTPTDEDKRKLESRTVPYSAPLTRAAPLAKPLAPATVTEALQDLLAKQEEIKRALDVLISDATTLRAQL